MFPAGSSAAMWVWFVGVTIRIRNLTLFQDPNVDVWLV